MSHRTQHLPPLTGLRHTWREIRYKESARQILGFVFVFVVTFFASPNLPLAYAGIPLILAGIAVRLWSSGHIMKNTELATDGPYAFVRHPLYTGNFLLLVGFAIAASLVWAYVVLAIFLWVYYPTAIEYEDFKLETLFDEQWRTWSAQTPALIPRRLWRSSDKSGQWSIVTSMNHNYEPVIAIVLLVCLVLIFIK
ncbi:MAG: isoprenylcysteine carboxylmethyltransferase family protein [Gammaproteobacteria bacterium]|nr:isoprenylcysteine carboxylmethyltransferase family protein [Gammaproteobacteria bacterium]